MRRLDKFQSRDIERGGVGRCHDLVPVANKDGSDEAKLLCLECAGQGEGIDRMDKSGNQDGLEHAIKEYGNAIRELAQANIFPGDMLWKNFGITRYGRVVFYDYDEIEYMTDINFRKIPPAPDFETEMSGEVWYPVARNDVFPEEFATFLLAMYSSIAIRHCSFSKENRHTSTQRFVRSSSIFR